MPSVQLRAAPLTPCRVGTAAAFVLATAAVLFRPDDDGGPFPTELRAPLMVLSVVSAAFLLLVAPIPQDESYHNFADRRACRCGCGFAGFVPDDPPANASSTAAAAAEDGGGRRGVVIPNFSDVASNLVILIGGVFGLAVLSMGGGWPNDVDGKLAGDKWQLAVCFPLLFVATALVSVGSAYYHWKPDNSTLVWDRLPMTVAFMAVFAFLLDERLHSRASDLDALAADGSRVGPAVLWPLVAVGAASVLFWHVTDDLRPYALVQFVPLLSVPVLLAAYPARYSGQGHIVAALLWYVAAKVCEETDREIYEATGRRVSGHTLKHVAAGFVPMCIAYMILVRKPLSLD